MSQQEYTSLTNISQLQRWINITCNRAGIHARYVEGIPTAYATEDSVVIPLLNNAVTKDDEAVLRWQIVHETVGHHNNGAEVFDILKEHKLRMDNPLGSILNIIEDQRIERVASSGYEGDALVISNGREVSGRRTCDTMRKLTEELAPDGLEEDSAKMQAIYLLALLSQSEWCDGAALHIQDEFRISTGHFTSVREHLTTLVRNKIQDEIMLLETGYDSFALAKVVYGLLWNKTPEEIEQEIQDNKAKAEQQEQDEKNGKGSKAEDGEGDAANEGGKDGTPVGKIDPRTGKYRIPFKYFVKSNHENKADIGHGLGLDYSKHVPEEVFVPIPFNEFRVRDYRREPPSRNGRLALFGGSRTNMIASTAFSNKMRRYLQVKTAAYYIGGQKRGTINSRSLYRAGVPMVGDGDWNMKVYRKKHVSELLDCSVSLVGDVSGSMSGPKVVHMAQSMMLLNHVISNVLHVNTEMLTFTFMGVNPVISIIKGFGDRASEDNIYNNIDDAVHGMWGNDDADTLLFAYDRLIKQKTKRKVMIVLSDGSPADGHEDTDPVYALKSVVKEIHEAKRVSIVGIGIMDRNVSLFYPEYTTIQRAEELEDCLLKVISNQILNGEAK